MDLVSRAKSELTIELDPDLDSIDFLTLGDEL